MPIDKRRILLYPIDIVVVIADDNVVMTLNGRSRCSVGRLVAGLCDLLFPPSKHATLL